MLMLCKYSSGRSVQFIVWWERIKEGDWKGMERKKKENTRPFGQSNYNGFRDTLHFYNKFHTVYN
jgi:hypothetical protein